MIMSSFHLLLQFAIHVPHTRFTLCNFQQVLLHFVQKCVRSHCSCRQCFVRKEQARMNGAWKKGKQNPEINLITPISRWHRFKHLKLCSQRKWNISVLIELKVCIKCNRAIQSKDLEFFRRVYVCASYVSYLSSVYFAKRNKNIKVN